MFWPSVDFLDQCFFPPHAVGVLFLMRTLEVLSSIVAFGSKFGPYVITSNLD